MTDVSTPRRIRRPFANSVSSSVTRKTARSTTHRAARRTCADAIAGVVYGLTYRREIWLRHNIPLTEIPASLIRRRKRGFKVIAALAQLIVTPRRSNSGDRHDGQCPSLNLGLVGRSGGEQFQDRPRANKAIL